MNKNTVRVKRGYYQLAVICDCLKHKNKMDIVLVESILTYSGIFFCIPIMTVFWNSVGMNQFMIGVSQMVCAATLFLFDVPMGYFADRFSRKALNVIGDIGIMTTFIFYTFAQNFWMVVVGEIPCGLFMTMSGGVDIAFLKIYSDKIDSTGELFKKKTAQLAVWQIISMCLAIVIGMFISKYSIKLTIFSVAIPFAIAAILASLPVIITPNLTTIWLFPLSGMAFGIVNIYIMPKI